MGAAFLHPTSSTIVQPICTAYQVCTALQSEAFCPHLVNEQDCVVGGRRLDLWI